MIVAAVASMALVACETYKVGEPERTNVSWLDGKYVCFGIDDSKTPIDTTLFELEITNTAGDAADAAWVTIRDYSFEHCWDNIYNTMTHMGAPDATAIAYANAYYGYEYFWPAIRVKVGCDAASKSFSVTNAEGTEPYTAYNAILEQSYYTFSGYMDYVPCTWTVSITDGKIIADAPTASGYKTDGISFTLYTKDEAGTELNYKVSGIRKTGWAEDMAEYAAWYGRQ